MVWHKLTLAGVIEHIPIGVAVTRPDGNIEYANSRLHALLDQSDGSLVGRELAAFRRSCAPTLRDAQRWQGEAKFHSLGGTDICVLETVFPTHDTDGVVYFIHLLQYLSAIHRADSSGAPAYYDSLTGLPNRNLFKERLLRAMLTSERTGSRFALCYLDVDRFKAINDTWGHDAGDKVLRETAERMSRALRKSDTLARLEGDEFATILGGVERPDDARRAADKLLLTGCEFHQFGKSFVRVTLSAGISLYPLDGHDAATLQQKADRAMYRAKADGGNVSWLTES